MSDTFIYSLYTLYILLTQFLYTWSCYNYLVLFSVDWNFWMEFIKI